MECVVCGNKNNILKSKHTFCPADHKVCTDCYYQIIKMCYCTDCTGEPIYSCPMCRNVKKYTNIEMFNTLAEIRKNNNPQEVYFYSHEDNNIFKKCIFYDCGCRDNVVDIKINNIEELDRKELINIANEYKNC